MGLIAAAITVIALAITATSAAAAAARAEYVAQADPICKSSGNQINKALPGLIKRISKKPNITPTIAFGYGLALGGKIFGKVTNRLAAIIPPPGDEATIGGWLDGRRSYKRLIDRAAAAGKHNKKKPMLRQLKRAVSALNQANQLVATFGFQYCVVAPE
jgi:hypothetical protein